MTTLIKFLTTLLKAGLSYHSLNSAKSAVLAIIPDENKEGNNRLLSQFMKGAYEAQPVFPRYTATWDVNKVFKLLRTWENEKVTLKQITFKIAMLLLLLSGRRGSSIIQINTTDVIIDEERAIIKISHVTKTTRPGYHVPDIVIRRYHDVNICIVKCLEVYIKRTKAVRLSPALIISFKTFKAISRDTLSRWIKMILKQAGINLIFLNHIQPEPQPLVKP